jgi:hypothetical protein
MSRRVKLIKTTKKKRGIDRRAFMATVAAAAAVFRGRTADAHVVDGLEEAS